MSIGKIRNIEQNIKIIEYIVVFWGVPGKLKGKITHI